MCANVHGHSGLSTSIITDTNCRDFFEAIFPDLATLQLTSDKPARCTAASMVMGRCLAVSYSYLDSRLQIVGNSDSDFAYVELPREGTLSITLTDGNKSSSRLGTTVLTSHKTWERETKFYSGLIVRIPWSDLHGRLSDLPKADSLTDTSIKFHVKADSQTIFLNGLRSLYVLHKGRLLSPEACDDLLTEATAQFIATNLHPQSCHSDDPLQTVFCQAQKLIIDKLNTNITVSDVADAMGISARYLQLAFKSVAGRSPKQFILSEKLEQSRRALMNDASLKIVEVSERYGFASPAHFSSAFKSRFGVSPHKARSQWQTTDCPVSHWLGQSMSEF